ncbi:MAG: dockerin type I domain-containing protein [Planctomycetota bacterium]
MVHPARLTARLAARHTTVRLTTVRLTARNTLWMLGLVAFPFTAEGALISTDGDFGEWLPEHVVATDASGDATGAFDVTSLSAVGSGSELRFRFDIGSTLNLPAGSGADGTLRVELGLPNDTLTIDFRSRRAYLNGNSSSRIPWLDLGFQAAPTYASSEYEVAVDLSAYGVAAGSTISMDFSGSDALTQAVAVQMGAALPADIRRSADRLPGTDFRVMSLNTRQSGLSDPSRAASLGRIIGAMDADVYAFQEESTSAAQVASILQSIDPFGDGAAWNVTQNSSNILASRSPIVPMPEADNRYVAGVVELPTGPVVALSIHPKCCGYIGSSEDATRIAQMQGVIDTIADLRAGNLGGALAPFADAPVFVIGDYNLVGSRTPLDMLEEGAGPDLARWQLPHQIGDGATTWRSQTSSFWPGQLDLLTYSPDALVEQNGFVFDSAQLNAGELSALGLFANDSGSSDHLALIADFALLADTLPGDANGDGAVDLLDFDVLAQNFGQPTAGGASAGDFNGDGVVDLLDFDLLSQNFGNSSPGNVPEPASLALLLLGGAAVVRRTR